MRIDIENLKAKILQMAISGKLVQQDPEDESAEILYEKIQEEKEKLIKEKKIRRVKLDEIKKEEIPFEIPDSWKWVRCNNIMDIRDGTHDTPKYIDEGIPLITSKNLVNNRIDFENTSNISEEDHHKISERSYVEKNDILMAMIGTIGNPVIVNTDKEFSIKNVALYKFYKKGMINSKFIFFYLLFSEDNMNKDASGGVQKFMSLTKLRNYLIPLPPLNEQKRMVEKIDELFSLIDKMVDLKQDSIKIINLLEEKVLEMAIKGKLVEQDHNDENAKMLYEKIQESKEIRISKENLNWKGFEKAEKQEYLYNIPQNWKWVRMGDINFIRRGASPRPIKEYIAEEGVNWIKIGDAGESRYIMQTKEKITKEGAEKSVYLEEGSLVLSNSMSYGHPYILATNGCIHDGWLSFQYDDNLLITEYIYYFLLASYKEFSRQARGTGVKNLNTTIVNNTLIPLVPLNEQKRIVEKLDITMNYLKELREKLG